jgi:membrane fusion protein (multidrug efflux system)
VTKAVGLAAIALVCACHRDDPEEPPPAVLVRCVVPEAASVDETLSLRGRLQPPPGGDLAVASQVGGKIMRIEVREGQRIATGDVVATVDDTTSRDAVRQADATLDQARASKTNADALLARTQELVARGIAARQELEDARAKAESARAGVASATAATDLAHRTLSRVQVRSTLDGVVTRVLRGVGALVDGTSSTPIVQLASTGTTEFVADATERELSSLDQGQPAKVTLAGANETLEGKVRVRSSALDPATGLGNVRVALEGPAPQAPIGTYGRVSIVTRHRDGVPTLPATALRGAVLDGAEVVVCKDGKADVRAAKVGYRDESRFEIVSGVAPGERVAIDHVLGLETGTPLREGK